MSGGDRLSAVEHPVEDEAQLGVFGRVPLVADGEILQIEHTIDRHPPSTGRR